MTRFAQVLFLVLLLGSYAAQRVSALPASSAENFRGEVWAWDEAARTVTLRRLDGTTVRIKVTPDQLTGLTLHQWTTVHGEVAPPAEIEHITKPAPSVTPVPKGNIARSQIAATVRTMDPAGTLTADSPYGRLRVWTAPQPQQRFASGHKVRVELSVQAVEMIPASPSPVSQPEAAVGNQPGDYAVVVGRIVGIDPGGKLRVESPRGPIEVWVGDAGPYHVAETVQVRTVVHPAR